MSDEKLRELERRWKETGAVEDEAAFLLERVRTGELTQERLELAAYCGHEGAGAALGPGGWQDLNERLESALPPESRTPVDKAAVAEFGLPELSPEAIESEDQHLRWTYPLTSFGNEVRVRMVLAAAGHVAHAWRPTAASSEEWRVEAERQFEAAREWAVCPCASHLQRASAQRQVRLVNWKGSGPEPRSFFGGPCSASVSCLAEANSEDEQRWLAYDATDQAARVLAYDREAPFDPGAILATERHEVRVVVGQALSAWALGLADPLAPGPQE